MPAKGYKYTEEEKKQHSISMKKWKNTAAGKEYLHSINNLKEIKIENYNKNPVLCKHCNSIIPYDKKSSQFCNHKCAAIYSNARRPPPSEETRKKLSIAGKSSPLVKLEGLRKKNKVPRCKILCKFCQKETWVVPSEKNRIYCNYACYLADENKKGGQGGYRIGSGRGKQGWYKNYWCDSSYELAFVMYNLDHHILFERNKEGFEYNYNGKSHKFYPDFIVNGIYTEIKGYFNDQQLEKIKQFPHKIEVIDKEKIKPYIKYAIETYGKNYIELYEGNPHNEKHNKCLLCGSSCVNKFCSQRCAGKDRVEKRRQEKL